jgi:4-amino-4-deoxy-L-arabinose transferase-like glycosyltransferase
MASRPCLTASTRPSGLHRLRDALDRLPDTAWPQLWLGVACLLLFLPGFFSIQPLDLGETRVAVATRQMLQSGDLLRIPAGHPVQPPGIHWVQAMLVRGLEALHLAHRSGIPAYRLASLLGALLAVLATHHWGRALVGRQAAFLGALMLTGCAALVAGAHLATADTLLLAVVVAAMGLFAAAYLDPRRFTARQAAGFWLAVAAGVLLRGSVAVLVPLLAGATLAVADRGAPWLRALRPGWGVPLLLAAALPWFVATGVVTEGAALAALLRGDLLGQLAGLGGQDRWPGFHLLAFAATAFPAAWIALLALPGVWRDRAERGPRFLLAWAVPSWLLFEATSWLPIVVLPAFPPLMLLAARWALDPLRPRIAPWLLIVAGLLLAGVAGAIGLNALQIVELDIREAPYGLLAMVAAILLVWRLLAHGRRGAWARAALLGTLLATPLYAALLQGILSHLPVARIADRIAGTAQRVAPGLPPEHFGVLGFDGASLRFAYGPEVQLLADGEDAARFLAAVPGRVVAIADMREGEFRRAAAAQGIQVGEEAMILSFDPYRGEFGIMIFYRVAGTPSG